MTRERLGRFAYQRRVELAEVLWSRPEALMRAMDVRGMKGTKMAFRHSMSELTI